MKYAHIARFVVETPWAITREKLEEIEAILALHMDGGHFSAEELRARIGDSQPAAALKRGAVAVLPLQGVIAHRMGGMQEMSGAISTERFAAMFRQVLSDDSIGAIVVDIDSPGGTIAGVTELCHEIYAARGQKPIVAQVNALAASAAYWIASACDEIVSTPSGQVGSIGVITAHLDTSKADESDGVTKTVISAGKYKAEGNGPLTDDARAAIQARVDEAYGVMVADIARGRGVKATEVQNGFGEGRVVSAKQAKDLGMIDRIATMNETIGRLVGRKAAGTGMRAEADAGELAATDAATAVGDEFVRRLRLL